MKKILVFALSCALLGACSSPSKDAYDESLGTPDSLKTTTNTGTVPAGPAQPVNGLNNLPQNQQPVVISQPQQMQPGVQQPVISGSLTAPGTTVPTATTSTAAGMNPPHGQPGHRCDIPVGAPLNSKAAAPTVTTTQPTTTVTPVNVPVTPTAPGMNPPHGQPGHRCDIAVGAPLNSAPAATTTPATNPAITVPVTPMTAPATTPAATSDTAKGGVTGSRGGK